MTNGIDGGVIDIPLIQLIIAYFFVLVLIIIVRKQKIDKEKQIILAATRMTLQLVIVGFLLEYIFEMPHPG